MNTMNAMNAMNAMTVSMDQPHIEVLAHHGRSFHLASHFLPQFAREDAAMLYAFCRYVDDIADETPDPNVARDALRAVRADMQAVYPRDRLVKELVALAAKTELDLEAADQLVEGVESDLSSVLFADDQDLIRYCYRVAGTVGVMMCAVLRVRNEAAIHFAIDLGIGMQLTNICRDVAEDAERNRVYLPADRLERAGTSSEAVLNGEASGESVAVVVRDLLELADRYYASADAGMRAIPMPARAAILVASRVYRAIGLRLLRVHGGNPLHGRTVVPTVTRLFWALCGVGRLLWPSFWSKRLPAHDRSLHALLSGLPRVDDRRSC